jgi:hypothetical protein
MRSLGEPIKEGYRGDHEYGTAWAVYPPEITDKEIENAVEWWPYSRGPGYDYARKPFISRTKTRVLVTQTCGRDI